MENFRMIGEAGRYLDRRLDRAFNNIACYGSIIIEYDRLVIEVGVSSGEDTELHTRRSISLGDLDRDDYPATLVLILADTALRVLVCKVLEADRADLLSPDTLLAVGQYARREADTACR